ncbi:MAG: ECF-type sigma factor [Acidobacteriota bacterium]|nr:ECF-type sigma factor [Acidobacteriota bacterium]
MLETQTHDRAEELPFTADILEEVDPADRETLSALLPRFYDELRQIAHAKLRNERRAHTLNTTALVNEVCLRLLENKQQRIDNKRHFFFLAGRAMRHLLVEHARRRNAGKRGGNQDNLPLDEAFELPADVTLDIDRLLNLDKALTALARRDRRQAHIVELKYFAGMTNEEVAKLLNLTERTISREWRIAKLFLGRALGEKT